MSLTQRKYVLFAVIFIDVLAADQVTKFEAVAHLTTAFDHGKAKTLGERLKVYFGDRNLGGEPPAPNHPDLRTVPVEVINHFWSLKYVENPGAAWGMFARMPPWFRVPFFHIVSIIAIAFLLGYLRRAPPDQTLLVSALSLVLGGAVGNYTDRLMRAYVIDFVDWHWFENPRLHWPTFNVADAAICVGVALLVGETLFTKRKVPSQQPPAIGDGVAAPPAMPAPSFESGPKSE
jgi:signal peptidase II